jgi:hypothetical protein
LHLCNITNCINAIIVCSSTLSKPFDVLYSLIISIYYYLKFIFSLCGIQIALETGSVFVVEIFSGYGCKKKGGYIGGNKMGDRLNNLYLRFQKKGFMPIEIPELVKDVLDIMGNQEYCTLTTVDRELEELGWGIHIMDNTTYELIVSLVKGNVS